jgi:hypothetical protein
MTDTTDMIAAADALEAQDREIEALRAALSLISVSCEHVHHSREDRHMFGEACPVVYRIYKVFCGEAGTP